MIFWISGYLPCRLINRPNDEPYLERYYIGTLFKWRFYLHRFVDTDVNEGTHNHPWNYAISIVLLGSYIQEVGIPGKSSYSVISLVNFISQNNIHRIVSCENETWTLFFHSPKKYDWGFFDEHGVFTSNINNSDGWEKICPIGKYSKRAPLHLRKNVNVSKRERP